MTKLTKDLSETQQSPAPEGLRDRVMSELELEGSSPPVQRPWTASPAFQFALVAMILFFLAAILFPVFSRARKSSGLSRMMAQEREAQIASKMNLAEEAPGSIPHAAPQPGGSGMPLMIIKTAEIKVEVKRFQSAFDQAALIAGAVGGYVTNSTAEQSGDAEYGTVILRVPVDSFERTLDSLGRLGMIVSKHITGEDVTGQVVDLEARLRNKRAEEAQYLEIMNRAKQIQDIVTVSNELYRVRGEIEEAQGRLKYLKSAVAMSTINVQLNEKGTRKPPAAEPSLWTTVTNAGTSLAGTGKVLARMLIWLLVYSPFWAIPIIVWGVVRRRSAAR